MTFKKDGTDPITARPRASVGGLTFIGQAILNALGIRPGGAQPEDAIRYRPTKRKLVGRQRPLRRNMNLVSKRVRRKHRRAA